MEKVINKYFIVQGLKSLGMIFAFGVLFIDRIRVMSFHYEDCLYGVSGIENSISNCNGIMSALYYTYGFHIYLLLFLLISSGVLIFFYRKHIKNRSLFYKKYLFLPCLLIFFLIQTYYTFIDFYNFRQFKKVKPILESISIDTPKFFGIEEFNERYNSDIKAINKCYDISTYNGSELYNFGFKLESLLFTYIYGTKYFVYPKYDLPVILQCVSTGCEDENLRDFKELISNKCEEEK